MQVSTNLHSYTNNLYVSDLEENRKSSINTAPKLPMENIDRYYNQSSQSEPQSSTHLFADRPLEFLSVGANEALAKSLEGKSEAQKAMIKAILSLEFMTSIHLNKYENVTNEKNSQTKTSNTKSFINGSYKNAGLDIVGSRDVLNSFINLYS